MAANNGSAPEKTSVQVALRIRPIDSNEKQSRFQRQMIDKSPHFPNQVIVQGEKKQTFNYDYVFGAEAEQKEVYETAVERLIDKFLEGYNVTILAYGQTSSGKTHTMGTAHNSSILPEQKGLIPRAMSSLFSTMNSQQYKSRKFAIKVSFIEIYNEELIDLLADYSTVMDEDCRPQVTIREDSKGNILWSGLQEIKVNGVDEVMSHLARGSLNRQVGATDMNAQSSRSHAIFSVTMSQQRSSGSNFSLPSTPSNSRPSTPTKMTRTSSRADLRMSRRIEEGEIISVTSKFHFVDLAGSERLKRTSAIGDRVKEGISINAGLLALGNVISALGDPTKVKHTTHIPYRDSKLTRLLQDSLGGNAQTLMIACISPSESNLNETINTLKYANRARNIKNAATVNSEEVGWNDLEHLHGLVLKLRAEIKTLKNNNNIATNAINAINAINATGDGETNNSSSSGNSSGSGRSTPTYMYGGPGYSPKRSSLSIVTNANGDTSYATNSPIALAAKSQNDKDIEILEDQLAELQRSYSELSQKYAKTKAELAFHQENNDSITQSPDSSHSQSSSTSSMQPPPQLESISEEEEHESDKITKNTKNTNSFFLSEEFQKAVEPVIEEYEKSVSNLESQIALNRAAIYHTETLMQEQEAKLEYAEKINEQNVKLIGDLRLKISEYNDKDVVSEAYIKKLEEKLEEYTEEQKRDQEMIKELKAKITQMKANEENSKGYIDNLESRLKLSDQKVEKFGKIVQKLEERLTQREMEFAELEAKMKSSVEEERRILSSEIETRDGRIKNLEKKVDELVNELESLSINAEDTSDKLLKRSLSSSSSSSTSSSSLDDNESTASSVSSDFLTVKKEYPPIAILESKLLDLQKTHTQTVDELSEIKTKYEECLQEIHELQTQLTEAQLCNSELFDDYRSSTSSTPVTPLSPENSQFKQRHSLIHNPIPASRMSLPAKLKSNKSGETPDQNVITLNSSNKKISHRRAKSLTPEIRDKEKRDMTHMAIVQKLQKELSQLESLHEDKSKGLEEIKKEFARLECNHRETLEIVEELRDEIKRSDSLAQVNKKPLNTNDDIDAYMTEDELEEDELLVSLREIEHLREELRKTLVIQEKQLSRNSDVEVKRIEENLRELREQLKCINISSEEMKDTEGKTEEELKIKIQELENQLEEHESSDNEEIKELQLKIEKLTAEIEAKSCVIIAFLYPSVDTIKRLEDELQKAREAYKLLVDELNSIPEDSSQDDLANRSKLLEEEMKDLELKLLEAKTMQKNSTPMIQKTIETLESNISTLQEELSNKSEIIKNLRNETELINELKAEIEPLKSDIKDKYELIETLKRDLVEKGAIEQKIKEKEEEANLLSIQLSKLKNRDEEMEKQIKEFQTELESLENIKKENEVLQSELDITKQELKDVKDKEIFALERLRTLDEEEIKLKQEIQQLQNLEKEQAERINELENNLKRQNELGNELTNLQDKLTLAKESESLHQKKISELESQLENSQNEYEATKNEINEFKLKVVEQREQIQLAELQISHNLEKDANMSEMSNLEVERLREQESEHCKKIEKLESELLEIKQRDNLTISSLNEELSALRNNKLDLVKTVEDLEAKLSNAKKETENAESIKGELTILKNLELEQKKTIGQSKLQLEKTIQEKELILKETEILKKDFGLQKEIVITLEDELKSVREELNKSKESNNESAKKIKDLSKLMKETVKQRGEEEHKIKTLEIQVQELNAINDAGDKNLYKTRRELLDAKDQMEIQNELIAKLGNQMIILEKERDEQLEHEKELINTIEVKEIEHKEAVEALESIINNLRDQLAEAKDSSQMDMETIAVLGNKLATVGFQLEEAKALEESRSKVVIGLEVKLKETNAAILEKEEILMSKDTLLKELTANAEKAKIQLDNAKISEAIESGRAKQLEMQLYGIQSRLHDLSPTEYEEAEPTKFVMEVEVKLLTSDNIDELKGVLANIKVELEKARAAEAEQAEIIRNLELQLQEADKCREEEIAKVKSAATEVESLREQCKNLQLELEDAYKDSLIVGFQKVDVSIVEELSKQLKKANKEAKNQKERVDELEKITKRLESEKEDKENQNKNLQQQVNKLQKEIESIAKEFDESTAKYNNNDILSQEQDKKIYELENALIEFKSNDDSANSPALSNLTAANDILRKTNENLNLKILQAQSRMKVLTQRIVGLELDLKKLKLVSKDDVTGNSVLQFKERIADLESEKEGLEQANASFREERKKLDQKIESLLSQLQLAGNDGNKVAAQLYELNGKIIDLENEVSNLNQTSAKDNLEMQKEIVRLLKVNEQLEKEMKQAGIKPKDSVQTVTKLENVPQRTQSLDHSIHSKLLQQESMITQQNNLIKSLQERVIELELRNDSETIHELNISGGGMFATDLDAVGGFRASIMSNSSEITKKKRPCVTAVANMPLSPPPTPPPSLPLPALPGTGINYGSRSSTPGCVSPPLRNYSSASRPESRLGLADLANSSAVELTVEIHKLHRKITKMEDESLENRQIVESLENSLSENEINLRVAKQQLQILQRDKMELLDQIKRLRSQLDETTTQFENAKSSVQEEKKVIETVLEEERRAKESAEKARRQLENRMEELMAKKSKFMCF